MSISATNRVLWKGISLGDHAYVSFAYQGNNDVRIVPRAKGAIIRSTSEMGGGILSITVNGVKATATRLALEQYFGTIDSSLTLIAPGSLVIDGTFTLTNCYLESFDQNNEDLRSNTFTFKFVKSL
jgi:hypothetical protein